MSLDFQQIAEVALNFVREHKAWAAPIAFAFAFGESLALISILVPGTILLVGVGGLIGASGINFWPVYAAAALGAAFGDWVSYWIGRRYEHDIEKLWPLSRYPQLVPRGHAFFEKWGVAAIFLGRFFGPVRAIVPLIAGVMEMPRVKFQLANFTSAFLWAFVVLAPGAFGVKWLDLPFLN